MSLQVNLSLNEIYHKLCPECQKKLRELVKDKLADQLIDEQLKEKLENG